MYLADTFGRAKRFMCEFRLFVCFAFALLCLFPTLLCMQTVNQRQSVSARPGLMLISLCCPPVLCTSACPKVMAPLYDADAAAEASASATLSYEHIEKSVSQSGSQSVNLAVSQLSSGRRYCFGAAGETDFKLIYSRPN